MKKFKKITHIFAVVLGAAATFIATPAGKALVDQYPLVSAISAGILALTALYHNPVSR